MAYVRISIVRPHRGQAERAEKLMRDLADSVAKHEGCTQSLFLKADDGTGEMARIAVYTDVHASAVTANDAHIMAIRSELHLVIEPGHIERSFESA
ncbi:MAG: hypothetical protein AB7T37_15860 [Dehalococcoidia bacterium]